MKWITNGQLPDTAGSYYTKDVFGNRKISVFNMSTWQTGISYMVHEWLDESPTTPHPGEGRSKEEVEYGFAWFEVPVSADNLPKGKVYAVGQNGTMLCGELYKSDAGSGFVNCDAGKQVMLNVSLYLERRQLPGTPYPAHTEVTDTRVWVESVAKKMWDEFGYALSRNYAEMPFIIDVIKLLESLPVQYPTDTPKGYTVEDMEKAFDAGENRGDFLKSKDGWEIVPIDKKEFLNSLKQI